MKAIFDFLVEHGPMLAVGVTLLLGLASALVVVHRQPIHRQRIAESSMLLCLLWLVLACIPLPRFSIDHKKAAPVKTLGLYVPQAGDEVIAAEVFKVANKSPLPEMSTGNEVPLPMPPQATTNAHTPWALRRNWELIFAQVYAGGAGVCVLYSLLGHALLHRLVARSRKLDVGVADARARARVRVRICAECERPISFGLWRPTILLPQRFVELDEAKQRHILHHELAHISQRDALGHLLFNLLFPLLYFHPLYWILRRTTNLARELIADDLAAARSSRESYVADLLALAKDRLGRAALATQALSLFQSKTDLYRRMHMLMQSKEPLARRCSIWWRMSYSILLAVALVIASGTFGLRRANAQTADTDQKADERKLAEEKSAQAAREAEVERLRREQDEIRSKLEALEMEKQKLHLELDKRRPDETKGDGAAAVYKRTLMQREQAIQQARENAAAELVAKIAAQEEEAAAQQDKAPKNQKWAGNKNAGGNREQNEFAGRAQLDLVSLANSYVDAIGNLQIAELEFERMNGKEKVFSQYEINRAKVQLEMARRKLQIFRSIAEAAREAAQVELEVANRNVKMGLAPENSVMEARSRLKIIEVILAQ